MASKRTVRPESARPPWDRVTETTASPPEHSVPVGQFEPCVEDGVMLMSLLIVPGFTVTTTVCAGVVDVSRTVRVTSVLAVTGFGTTVRLPRTLPESGMTAWLLEETMYEPVPPVI